MNKIKVFINKICFHIFTPHNKEIDEESGIAYEYHCPKCIAIRNLLVGIIFGLILSNILSPSVYEFIYKLLELYNAS